MVSKCADLALGGVAGHYHSLREVIDVIAGTAGRPAPKGQPPRVASAEAERVLGASFRPLDETIRDVVGWYEEHHRLPSGP